MDDDLGPLDRARKAVSDRAELPGMSLMEHLEELRKRLLHAVQKAKLEIVVNFEHVRHATPQAFNALLDGDYLQSLKAHASVKFINLKTAFQAGLDRIVPAPAAWGDEIVG